MAVDRHPHEEGVDVDQEVFLFLEETYQLRETNLGKLQRDRLRRHLADNHQIVLETEATVYPPPSILPVEEAIEARRK